MRITADQALAWRLHRQFLSPRTAAPVTDIVQRLGGVQMQLASAAQTAVTTRQQEPAPGEIATGLANGTLIKTWAMRGTLHLCTPGSAAEILSLVASARTWTKPSWQKTFGATPDEIDRLAEAVAEMLDGTALTREELVAGLLARPEFRGMAGELRSGWGTLLKPLAWQGVLCHGPLRDTSVTFTTPSSLVPGWAGLPAPDEAAPEVIATYLGAYGPATPDTFSQWLLRGAFRKSVVAGWFSDLGERITEVSVDGQKAFVLTEHADELAATHPSHDVHLLGPFDAYVLGATTRDTWMLPAEHRGRVSRTAGWIAPVVLSGGRVVGTWELEAGTVVTDFFPGGKSPSAKALAGEVARVTGA
ncbi:winged helix DNA-binding domain-containing protein [Kineosporia succinea]|uniref:Winged helix DNA-binding protein n=1 Tax=Kineosporia succinea TaxID=84632 RepID=A0ABT9P049_9ACTN|nr:winged helix DNA-binding domain-containing protein [Kineosporia succinea]MDP9826058.1 hypothetical protein [Kineosporia succinea]